VSLFRRASGLITIVLAACTDPSGPDGAPPVIAALPRQLTAVEAEMVSAANTFGVNLLKHVNESFADSNVFMSPLSASMALGMTMNGAEGETFAEMRSSLGFGDRTYAELNSAYRSLIDLLRGLDPKVEFRIANAIYHDVGFGAAIEPTFLDEARQYFDADVRGFDFTLPQSVDSVNAWASRNTNGRIPTILEDIEPHIVMLLMNAIYFKGDWRDAFKTSETRTETFHGIRGDVPVSMMHRAGGFRIGRTQNAVVAELPYGGDAFVMTILLPDEGSHINSFVAGLSDAVWTSATANLADARDHQDLYLPKFKLAWEDTLNNELKSLGMQRAFRPREAQFTRLSRSRGNELYIDFVKQKAFVDVNEIGTEAAAVTVVGIGEVSAPLPVRLDRPFVFAIRERLSGTVLFLGKIVEPKTLD
jgi:serine protease inhibitor